MIALLIKLISRAFDPPLERVHIAHSRICHCRKINIDSVHQVQAKEVSCIGR